MLDLADKYDMPKIFDAFLPRCVNYWPLSLADWDCMRERVRRWQRACRDAAKQTQGSTEVARYVEPVEAINLARRHTTRGTTSILPSAFYALSCTSESYDVYATENDRLEGTAETKLALREKARSEFLWRWGGMVARWELLDREDWRTL